MKPIIFTTPMVRAILSGQKTQTRRIIKPQQTERPIYDPAIGWRFLGGPNIRCPYGQTGDLLWVRETFYCDDFRYPHGPREELLKNMDYRASHDCGAWEAGCPCRDEEGRGSWRPSIHMPRWAARIFLKITDIRVERLQDISDGDVYSEGIGWNEPLQILLRNQTKGNSPAQRAFSNLWDSINAKRGFYWESNPWVWVIEFERWVIEFERTDDPA